MDTPIYLALDFQTWEETNVFIETNQLQGVPVKVGMELFYKEGPKVIEKLKGNNHPIFLDLKLHDIPNTVKRAMRNLASLGVDLVNVHALGGGEMIQAAKEGLELGAGSAQVPKLLAVTLLTSMDELTLKEQLLIQTKMEPTVQHLAQVSKENGADGVVCSAHEVPIIKEVCHNEFLTVTPGIRLANSENNDQKRVATPGFARKNGADAIVIGRSITQASKPRETHQQAIEEWNDVTK